MVRKCKVCGAEYTTCFSCEKGRSWRIHTDTVDHYYILGVLMEYQSGHDTKKVYQALRKRGVDLRETEGYLPDTQKMMAEIYALTHESSKERKATVKTELVVSGQVDTEQIPEKTEEIPKE